MIQKCKNKMLQVNKQIKHLKEGSKVKVKVDPFGNVMDRYWRKKIKDAETDGCVSLVSNSKPKSTNVKEKKNDRDT